MPAIHPSLLNRSLDTPSSASNALQVICAWPVSGQYGPGTRVLYYVLIATCVFGRRAEWIRNACLAAALLFPAVAGLHGIVLASLHNDDAVDMDVFGAFQFCSIGVLTAPVTVRLSRTYFNEPGRNIIFLWTGLILAGLVSLTVEFYRITTHNCMVAGHPLSKNSMDFLYGDTTCGLTCSVEEGPFSPMRRDAANNIYVIPAPERLTFGAATLLAAACCIPAVLSIVSMWNRILDLNWTRRFGNPKRDIKRDEEVIEGTNGATFGSMKNVNELIRSFLRVVEIPLFSAAVLVIIIIGERNFFSHQVQYQTEPIQSIGQWAPIVGAGLAVIGSLSLFLAVAVDDEQVEAESGLSSTPASSPRWRPSSDDGSASTTPTEWATDHPHSPPEAAMGIVRTPTQGTVRQLKRQHTEDVGKRRKVAQMLIKFSERISNAAYDRYSGTDFMRGPATGFPEIPGEDLRNGDLERIRRSYNPHLTELATPVSPGQTSRMGSVAGSIYSHVDPEHSPTALRPVSPTPSIARRSRASMSQDRRLSEVQAPTSYSPSAARSSSRPRGNTLEVPRAPPRAHNPGTRSRSSTAPDSFSGGLSIADTAPVIIVSPDLDMPSPAQDSPQNSRPRP
ncbi:uncharacterized protein ACLA_072370 [Aspergillus clavatus NRRL 1]|uniref:Uncharacterized protein n=1 Tax=Aspergillus clavatus (strain ATCC 1007 / CBS 513.65 / DSM 816 / NCTC 3887 / NRRL 1 / QM 1276 / 107) TaxID=344612 RepID=A1C733_ASPCL|nr:uncharacterized protein ACLA_072370 [Aspergillus clavatus NRRL 1]EAW14204.1 conserved hypothetical protein [Aspergillus clavatus NRRL 1]